MNNACPVCGTTYGVTPQHVGQRLQCKQCQTALVVQADGLKASGAAPAAAPSAAAPGLAAIGPASAPTRSRATGSSATTKVGLEELPPILFAAGAFLCILFLFLPLIDGLKHVRAQATLQQMQQDSESKNDSDSIKDQQKYANSTRFSVQRWAYAYAYGMLLGFWLLGAGCLGFVFYGTTTSQRVLGSVVLCGQMMAIIWFYSLGSFVTTVGGAGSILR